MATLNANPIIYKTDASRDGESRDDSTDTSASTPEQLPSLFSTILIPPSVLTGPAPSLSSFFPLTASSLPNEPFAFSDSAPANSSAAPFTSPFFSQVLHSTKPSHSPFQPSTSSPYPPTALPPFSPFSPSSPSLPPVASVREPWDALEVFDLVRSINDPEHPLTLEQLNVTQLPLIAVDDSASHIAVRFTPTIPHCSMATLIGLCIRVKLIRSLPTRFKVDITITKGAHATEDAINKQLNDKERVAAALENTHLLDIVNKCLNNKPMDM